MSSRLDVPRSAMVILTNRFLPNFICITRAIIKDDSVLPVYFILFY